MSETKRQADIFTAARQLYNARRKLREKADKLMADAEPKVRAICESIEEEEANEPIDKVPSSPENPTA